MDGPGVGVKKIGKGTPGTENEKREGEARTPPEK